MKFIVRDNITCETLFFSDKADAQIEAERRLSLHKHGFLRMKGSEKTVLIESGNQFIITRC